MLTRWQLVRFQPIPPRIYLVSTWCIGKHLGLSHRACGFDSRRGFHASRLCIGKHLGFSPRGSGFDSRPGYHLRRSPCWAPRQLIPVCATVRFRRLRLSVRPLEEALHAKQLVRLQTGPLTGLTPTAGTLLVREHPSWLLHSGARRTFSGLVRRQRGASGEAMAVAPDARQSVR